MSFLCKMACFLALTLLCAAEDKVLRIAADPNNLPFSNDKLEGFENKIADLIARELGKEIEYVWRAQRRGFFRETFREGDCHLVLGVPTRFDPVLCTTPYYRSSYVFVCRSGEFPDLSSISDVRLRTARIGVHLIGDDGNNTPPAHALAELNIITNVIGFTIYGDYSEPNPPARIVEAVARKEIDAAIIWGPFAGYFAAKQASPLEIKTLAAPGDLPFEFSIAMGVKKGNKELQARINEILALKKTEIRKILAEYNIPLIDK